MSDERLNGIVANLEAMCLAMREKDIDGWADYLEGILPVLAALAEKPACDEPKYDEMRDCFWRDGIQYLPITHEMLSSKPAERPADYDGFVPTASAIQSREYEFGLQCSAHARKLGFDVGDGDWQDIQEVVVGLFSAGRKYAESSAERPQLSAEQVREIAWRWLSLLEKKRYILGDGEWEQWKKDMAIMRPEIELSEKGNQESASQCVASGPNALASCPDDEVPTVPRQTGESPAALLTGEAEKLPPATNPVITGDPSKWERIPAPAAPPVLQAEREWRTVIVGLPIIRKLLNAEDVTLNDFHICLIPDDVLWNNQPRALGGGKQEKDAK